MEQRCVIKCSIPEKDVQFHAIVSDDEYFGMQHPQDAVFVWLRQHYSDRQLKKDSLFMIPLPLLGLQVDF